MSASDVKNNKSLTKNSKQLENILKEYVALDLCSMIYDYAITNVMAIDNFMESMMYNPERVLRDVGLSRDCFPYKGAYVIKLQYSDRAIYFYSNTLEILDNTDLVLDMTVD